jgi:hypothetical protein
VLLPIPLTPLTEPAPSGYHRYTMLRRPPQGLQVPTMSTLWPPAAVRSEARRTCFVAAAYTPSSVMRELVAGIESQRENQLARSLGAARSKPMKKHDSRAEMQRRLNAFSRGEYVKKRRARGKLPPIHGASTFPFLHGSTSRPARPKSKSAGRACAPTLV